MRIFLLLILAAFSGNARGETMEDDYHPATFDKFNKAEGEYTGYRIGDHYEWTLYGARYDKRDYGHKYEWSTPGLSAMSVCIEMDEATGGKRWREMADDAYCGPVDAEYKWDVPFEGQPSRCLKVDKVTHGLRFSRIVDAARCEKPRTIIAWERKHPNLPAYCVEVDSATNGGVYRQSVPDYLCAKTVDTVVAFGKEKPALAEPSRSLASIAMPRAPETPLELDPRFREEPGELEDGVEHVHRSADLIHHDVAAKVTGEIPLSSLRVSPSCLDTIYRQLSDSCGRDSVDQRKQENRVSAWGVESTVERNTPLRVILNTQVRVNGARTCRYRVTIENKQRCDFIVGQRSAD